MEVPYRKEQPQSIQRLFSSIAPSYDRTNVVMTMGLFKRWNQALVRYAEEHLTGPLLDLCAGTGEIALGYLRRCGARQQAHLLDFCPEMLELARYKAQRLGLEKHDIAYLEADAQQIPLESESVSGVTMAYGIRNVEDPLRCAAEVHRTLKPGGFWAILELTRPRLGLLRALHRLYIRTCLPWVGRLLTRDRQAYGYLSRSVEQFVAPQELATKLSSAGFEIERVTPLLFGVATLIVLKKN